MMEMESNTICISANVISSDGLGYEHQHDNHNDNSHSDNDNDRDDGHAHDGKLEVDQQLEHQVKSESVEIDDDDVENKNNHHGNGIENDLESDHIHFSEEEGSIKKVFSEFDENSDGVLDDDEFSAFLQTVFHNQRMTEIPKEKRKAFMKLLDSNSDGVIDFGEFKHAWSHCFKQVLNPVTALIIVDVQYDFIDGTLALKHCPAKQDGAEVIPVINKLLEESKFDMVVYSMDWHPENHISFVDNVDKYPIHHSCVAKNAPSEWATYDEIKFDLSPPRSQILWPAHCVQGTDGAKLHGNLTVVPDAVNIYKGTKTDIDSYSAFFDNMRLSHTAMQQELRRRNVTDVYVCGLAYDICVAATSRDSVELGYRTVVVDDACRGVNDDNIKAAKEQLTELGALILQSDDVIRLVNKEDCSFDLGVFAAQTMPAATAPSS